MPEINKDTVELKKNTIEIKILIDKPSQMAKITCDGKCIMEGNFWDFYSGCHGIIEWGDFNSMEELIENIAKKYKNDGYIVSIIRESYKYEQERTMLEKCYQ